MSVGNNPADGAWAEQRRAKFAADADAAQAARLAGHKSPFRRLLERLRPHRQEPGDDSDGSYGANG
jgi:hypothetical protein